MMIYDERITFEAVYIQFLFYTKLYIIELYQSWITAKNCAKPIENAIFYKIVRYKDNAIGIKLNEIENSIREPSSCFTMDNFVRRILSLKVCVQRNFLC